MNEMKVFHKVAGFIKGKKILNACLVTLLVIFLNLFSHSGYSNEYIYAVNTSNNSGDTIYKAYYNIIYGLKLEYVRYYKRIKSYSGDIKAMGWPESDWVFKRDSTVYWESYQRFFRQDRKFVEWLLTFKYDYARSDLWQMGFDPTSSYRGDWFHYWNNSRAAITLIQNFLDGSGFKCYECGYPYRQKCIKKQYREVEKFLKIHKSKDINVLRQAWKKYNPNSKYRAFPRYP